MPITITSDEINPILHCNRPLSPNTQCRIGLISAEVIVIGIVNPMPLFPSLFPAGGRSAPAGPKICFGAPATYVYIYIYIYVCPHLKIIMLFIHIVLEECTP